MLVEEAVGGGGAIGGGRIAHAEGEPRAEGGGLLVKGGLRMLAEGS